MFTQDSFLSSPSTPDSLEVFFLVRRTGFLGSRVTYPTEEDFFVAKPAAGGRAR